MPPYPPVWFARGLCHRQISTFSRTRPQYQAALSTILPSSFRPRFTPQELSRLFHSSTRAYAEAANHYETLGLTPDANGAEIKKQFYQLSKLHHPDHNPDDPTASTRFQNISHAYSILGKPAKRQAYDRSLGIGGGGGGSAPPSGSYSSAQRSSASSSSASPFGARSASGLNKRRGAFRGPPPSFYASGGWGAHASKRRAAQQTGSSASSMGGSDRTAGAESNQAHTAAGGTYGGGGAPGSSGGMPGDEVPHFDRQRHFERQEEIDERMAARRRARREAEEREREALQRDLGFKVLFVTACVAGVWLVDVLFVSPRQHGKSRVENKKREKR